MFIIPEKNWQKEAAGNSAMHRMLLIETSYSLICGYFQCPTDSPVCISKSVSRNVVSDNLRTQTNSFEYGLNASRYAIIDPEKMFGCKNSLQELLSSQAEKRAPNPIGHQPINFAPEYDFPTYENLPQTFQAPPAGKKEMNLPSFKDFVYEAVQRTHLPLNSIVLALFYIRRLHLFNKHCTGNQSSPHRLMLAALMVACKHLYDETYSNRTWVNVSQNKFTMQEVNKMEWEFLQYINFRLTFTVEEWNEFVQELDVYMVQYWLQYYQPMNHPKYNFVPNLLHEPSLKFTDTDPNPNPLAFPKCKMNPIRLPTPPSKQSPPFAQVSQAPSVPYGGNTYHPFTTPALIEPMYSIGQQFWQTHHQSYPFCQPNLIKPQVGYPWSDSFVAPTQVSSYSSFPFSTHQQPYAMAPQMFHYTSYPGDRFDSATEMSSKHDFFLNQKVMVQH